MIFKNINVTGLGTNNLLEDFCSASIKKRKVFFEYCQDTYLRYGQVNQCLQVVIKFSFKKTLEKTSNTWHEL